MNTMIDQQDLNKFVENFKKEHSDWHYENIINLNLSYNNLSYNNFFYLNNNLNDNFKKDIKKYNTYWISIINNTNFMVYYQNDRTIQSDDTIYYCNSFEEAKILIEFIYNNLSLYTNNYTEDLLNSSTYIF